MDARVDSILVPISGDDPCGEDMSFSSEFDQIQEARREDDPTVDYGEWQTTLKQADWRSVIASCTELLESRSKDLRLAAWLAEASVKTSGLQGLYQGVETIARLIAHFGDKVHPRGDDEADHERRIGTLSWLVMRMSQLVRQIPITRAKAGSYSLGDHESAQLLQAQLQRGAESADDLEDKVTLEKFAAAVAQTDRALYVAWIEDAARSRSAVDELVAASDALFGVDGPSFASLEEGVDALCRRLGTIGRELGLVGAKSGSEPEEGKGAIGAQEAGSGALVHDGPIANRTQALALLRQVAAFFHRTEPHSPVAYLADKAACWGDMPLHAWLRSVVKDNGTLGHIEELLGLQANAAGADKGE